MFEMIGNAYEERGSYNMAIYFFKEKAYYLESSKAEQTIDVLNESSNIYNRLGTICCYGGYYDTAIQYYERALSIQLQLGCNSIEVATARYYTGTVQYQLGQYQSSLLSLQEALTYYRDEVFDADDRDQREKYIASTLYNIGIVHVALCDYDVAMHTLQEAYDIQYEKLGIDHPYALRTRREIGNLYTLYIDDVPVALNHFQTILTIQKRIYQHLEQRHPNIAETYHSIGVAYIRQKDYATALRTLEDCYYMQYDFFNNDHPIQAKVLYDIATVHLLRHNYQKVLQICNVIFHIQRNKLREPHVDIVRTYTMIGASYIGIGNLDTAFQYINDAYSMSIQCFNGKEYHHVCFGEIYTQYSLYYLLKCQFDTSRTYIQKVLHIYQQYLHMDSNYDGINHAQQILHRIEHDEMLCV
jgi:tetratricopeptide (TPR) repeat protein